MKSRHEEIISVNAILATRYHVYSDLIRAAIQISKINHHCTMTLLHGQGSCPTCGAETYLELGEGTQISGPASDFTCEQVQTVRGKK